MKKSKEWLKDELGKLAETADVIAGTTMVDGTILLKKGEERGYLNAIDLIDQLEEPELPVIPQFVADFIEVEKKDPYPTLANAYNDSIYNSEVSEWLEHYDDSDFITDYAKADKNQELFARAWIGDYTIEKEPDKLYEVKLPTENAMGNTMNLVQGGSKNRVWFDSLDDRIVKFKFTEKEIKSIDERYWAFAVEVMPNE